MIQFSIFFCHPNRQPKQWYDIPHVLHPPPATFSMFTLPQLSIAGWLLCLPFKFWPLKAKAPFCLYFLACVVLRPQNKSTNSGTTKPDHGRLARDHRRPLCHVLWVPLTYPWRERSKPLEGRVAASHVVCCCVFCVLCFVVLERTFSYWRG